MGHKSAATTARYARVDPLILATKLEYADGQVAFSADDWVQLPARLPGNCASWPTNMKAVS